MENDDWKKKVQFIRRIKYIRSGITNNYGFYLFYFLIIIITMYWNFKFRNSNVVKMFDKESRSNIFTRDFTRKLDSCR